MSREHDESVLRAIATYPPWLLRAPGLRNNPQAKEFNAVSETINDFITSWLVDAINGAGGLRSYQDHEYPVMAHPDDVTVAIWIVRCLGNPRCEGSQEVVDAIIKSREDQAQPG